MMAPRHATGLPKRRLGRDGPLVSEIGFGSWAIGGSAAPGYGPSDDEVSRTALWAALDLGCTFFDTADSYGAGHSERLLGDALATARNSVTICTKAGYVSDTRRPHVDHSPDHLRAALTQSLRRLRTDHVDLFLLHDPPAAVIVDPHIADTMADLRAQGQAKLVGVSARTVQDAQVALRAPWVQAIEIYYNMLAPEAELLFPAIAARGIALLVREPLANGFLTGRYSPRTRFHPQDVRSWRSQAYLQETAAKVALLSRYKKPGESMTQLALRFALDRPEVGVVIVGCRSPAQVIENMEARDDRGKERD